MKNILLREQKVMTDTVYEYTHEQWFSEFSNFEHIWFSEYIGIFRTNPQEFLELLANRKEQKTIFERLLKLSKLKREVNKEKKKEVEEFFQQVPIERILTDVMEVSYAFDYVVEKNVAEYVIGVKDGDLFTAYSEEKLRDGELSVIVDDEEKTFTVQALIYFIFVNELLHQKDEERVVCCKVPYSNAIYALSYAQAFLEEDLKKLLIHPTKTFVTSSLITIIVFSKTLRFLSDVADLEEYADDELYSMQIQEQYLSLISRQQTILGKCYFFYLQSKLNKLENREKQSLKKQQELQNKLEKQQHKIDVQNEKIQQLKNELTDKDKSTAGTSSLERQYNEKLKEMEQMHTSQMTEIKLQLKTAKENLKDEKKTYTREVHVLEGKLEDQIQENKRLISDVSNLQKQLTTEKRLKLQMEELNFADWLEKGREIIQHLTLEEEDELKGFIELAQNIMHEQSLARPKDDLATNKIGYCRVDENGHFVNFGDDEWHELTAIPAPIYLSDNQFVEVTKDLELVNALNYYFVSGPVDYAIKQFVMVEDRHGEAFAKVNGKTKEIKYRDNAFIKDGQVISINQHDELVSYYQYRPITLDDWLVSIQLKGHKPLYVTLALSNGFVVRNLAGEESFIQLEEQLPAHSFVITDDQNQVMYSDLSGRMLKCSNQYTKKQLASVSEIDEEIYVLKENQEYVQLKDVVQSVELELGDMVWIDEYNRFIDVVQIEEQFIPTDTIEKKLLDSGRKVTRKLTKEKVEKTKDLLVIGNVRISERYKSYFGSLGYEVEVVDGTGPFEKIRQACTKHENILYSTVFTSHKNSGKMSKEVLKPYILCDSTAPKVMHYALEGIS